MLRHEGDKKVEVELHFILFSLSSSSLPPSTHTKKSWPKKIYLFAKENRTHTYRYKTGYKAKYEENKDRKMNCCWGSICKMLSRGKLSLNESQILA